MNAFFEHLNDRAFDSQQMQVLHGGSDSGGPMSFPDDDDDDQGGG